MPTNGDRSDRAEAEADYRELERKALFELSDDDDEEQPDLIGSLTGAEEAAAKDMTLAGYVEEHDRVPAFEGSDGQPYTVDVDVEHDPDATPAYAAFLVFIRWAETGAGIMDHVESGDVAHAAAEDDARRAAMELSLYEIKAELDAAIARRREALED
ncbi:MAG TPA: hypothetical protein VHG09_11480 [Longimicrobiales bacterium]|nr:hypothetical protein [Longimicrobiales bacterium]